MTDVQRISGDQSLYEDLKDTFRRVRAGILSKGMTVNQGEVLVRNSVALVKAMEVDLHERQFVAALDANMPPPARVPRAKGAFNGRQLALANPPARAGAEHIAREKAESTA